MVDTLAASYLPSTSSSAGSAAEGAAQKKVAKYSAFCPQYEFIPLAFETLGPINSSALSFLSSLGRRTSQATTDNRETAFLFQRLSVLIQRFNAVCFRNSFKTNFCDEEE